MVTRDQRRAADLQKEQEAYDASVIRGYLRVGVAPWSGKVWWSALEWSLHRVTGYGHPEHVETIEINHRPPPVTDYEFDRVEGWKLKPPPPMPPFDDPLDAIIDYEGVMWDERGPMQTLDTLQALGYRIVYVGPAPIGASDG